MEFPHFPVYSWLTVIGASVFWRFSSAFIFFCCSWIIWRSCFWASWAVSVLVGGACCLGESVVGGEGLVDRKTLSKTLPATSWTPLGAKTKEPSRIFSKFPLATPSRIVLTPLVTSGMNPNPGLPFKRGVVAEIPFPAGILFPPKEGRRPTNAPIAFKPFKKPNCLDFSSAFSGGSGIACASPSASMSWWIGVHWTLEKGN